MSRKLLGMVALAVAIAVSHSTKSYAQEEDVLALASKLTGKSAELQKVQDELKNKREEIKKETEAVKADEKKVDELRAASRGGRVRVSVGQRDIIVEKGGEVFLHFIERPSRDFGSYEEAIEAMKRFDLTPQSVTITDIATGKRLTEPPPKPDTTELDAAAKALADRQGAADRAVEKYKADKAAYDRDLAAYDTAVDRLNQSLPEAIKEAGSPTPTSEQLNAPKGDYQVEDLSALATKYKGQTAKDGTAVAFVQEAGKLPEPEKWGKGTKVEGTNLRAGTPIATFKPDGTFTPGKGHHAAIYVTQNKKGIWVYDQYKATGGEQRPVETRFIRFKKGTGSNDASTYSVIKKKVVVPDLPPDKP
jgi:hypothetical protein